MKSRLTGSLLMEVVVEAITCMFACLTLAAVTSILRLALLDASQQQNITTARNTIAVAVLCC